MQKLTYHARLTNLLIVTITQCIVIFLLLKTPLVHSSPYSIISIYMLIVTCTIVITMGGYFINDYFDYEIDSVNKKTAYRFGKAQLLQTYFITNLIGFGMAIGICSLIGRFDYLYIYIGAIGILFLYASHLKRQGLIGNIVVSMFSSLVIGLLWFIQDFFDIRITEFQQSLMLFFMAFIFLASMARELVKDCEDILGDKEFNLKTLPIQIGIDKTNIFVRLFLVSLLFVSASWFYWILPSSSLITQASLIPIILLNLYIIILSSSAKKKEDFARNSSLIKILMGLGILSLSIISYQS